jgi:hypothetical protein
MARLNDISNAALRGSVGGFVSGNAGFAAGTNAGSVKTTNAINYAINGIVYAKAATDNQTLAASTTTGPLNATTTTYVQPLNTTVYYVVCYDSAGTLSMYQGSYAGQDLGGGAKGDGSIPDVPSTVCPIGMFKVTSSTLAYTIGAATALTSGNYGTVTFYSLSGAIPVGSV